MKNHKILKQFITPGLALALAVTVLSSLVAQATPYASQVTKSGNTVTFILNQTSAGITVLRDGVALAPPLEAVTPGLKTFDMSGYTAFSIIVTGNTAKAWTQISSDSLTQSKYYSPRGVDVDRNPKRSTFGRIIVSEGMGGAVAAGGRTTTDGLYIMSADQGDVFGQGNTAYAGGIAWPAESAGANGPFKVSMNRNDPTGEDYTIYIGDFTATHSGIWTANALNPSAAFNELLDNTGRDAAGIVLEGGGVGPGQLHGSVPAGPWVEGAGASRKMYTVDEDVLMGNVLQYDIGTTTSGYSTAPTVRVDDGTVVANSLMDVVRDADGSWWIATYRYTDADGAPSLSRWADGSSAPSWKSGTSTIMLSRAYGCLDIIDEQDLLVVGSNNSRFWILDISNPDSPVLLNMITHVGSTIRDVAFDSAGNIYVVSPSSETLRIYSPGGLTITTTKSDGTFNLLTPDTLRVTATDADAAETGSDPAIFTITRSGGPNKALEVTYTLTGTAGAGDYNVVPASPFIFKAGQTSTNITVTPIDDAEREATETVVLTVATDPDYDVGSPSSATAYIIDNDAVWSYWDTNDITAGACGEPSGLAGGTWGTDPYWSTDSAGGVATTAWYPTNIAVFSAGTDAFGTFTVTLNGAQRADSLSFEEGEVTLSGGPLTLTNFAGIQIASGLNARIDSVLDGAAGLTVDGPGTLYLGGANTYTGPTTIKTGTVVLAASERIPNGSALILGGTNSALDLSTSGVSETVASLAGSAGAQLLVPSGQTFTFGDANNTTWNGDESGGGTVVKLGTGKVTMSAGSIADALTISAGTVSINSPVRLGAANDIAINNGAILESSSGNVGGDFVTPARTITIGAAGGTLKVTDFSGVLMVRDASVISGTGTLTKGGPGELRTYSVEHSFPKLIVEEGLYTAGHSTLLGYNTSFGAIPTSVTADAITIYGGAAIRKAGGQNVALDPKQGITLTGTGTKTIRSYAGNTSCGTFEITGTISGTGPLQLPGPTDSAYAPIMVLEGQNTYSDGTIVQPGQVHVINSFAGSGTGSGSVTVNSGATLGGEGSMGGPVAVTGGNLSPGYTYYTGDQTAPTEVTKAAAKLVLTNGLNLSAAGTYIWQLGALSEANPGTDFDQVELTGGNLTLGGSSALAIGFTGTATAPDVAEPFWQQSRQWKVVSLSGGGSISGNFSSISGTNGITAGTFSTTTDATGVTLVYTVVLKPVDSVGITNTGGGNFTIGYAGGSAAKFVLLQTNNLAAPMTDWARVKTNYGTPGTFTITPGADPVQFYRVKSE